jgi:hypothetical protein
MTTTTQRAISRRVSDSAGGCPRAPAPTPKARNDAERRPRGAENQRLRAAVFAVAALLGALAGAAPASAAQPPAPSESAPLVAAAPNPEATSLAPPPLETAEPAIKQTPAPAVTAPPFRAFNVTADSIDWYSNRYILEADGHVVVNLVNRVRLTGNTFSFDVRLNRFVIAGHVTLTVNGHTYEGAAFSDYLDFDRQYFVPSLSEPDRWTFADSDYGHPLFGRQMPGDTFFLPDLSRDSILVKTQHVVVQPRESISFSRPLIKLGLVYVPFPHYFLYYGPNPNFAQNSLPGADVDGPLDLYGGGHGLITQHLRYDATDKIYFADEIHQVSDKHYLVASISPIDKVFKHYNFFGFDRVSPTFQVQTQLQENAFQHGFTQPLSATGYGALQLTQAFPHSYLQWQSHSYYQSLLDQPKPGIDGLLYYGDPSHNWVPDHPDDVEVTWHGFQNRIFKTPFYLTTRVAEGFAHDSINPPEDLGNVAYKTIWNDTFGFNVALPGYKLIRDYSGHNGDLYLNATFDKQREYFSLPHHTDTTQTTFSLSRQFDRHLIGFVSYQITNTADFYGSQQSLVYNPDTVYRDPRTNAPVPEWSAFRGFGTQRSLVETLVFTPTTYFTTNLIFRQNHDFPIPLAAYTYQDNIGLEPYQATIDVRFRVSPTISLDLQRSYYFNFGGIDRWSPAFFIQVLR